MKYVLLSRDVAASAGRSEALSTRENTRERGRGSPSGLCLLIMFRESESTSIALTVVPRHASREFDEREEKAYE